jgi:MFS family permease
MPSQPAIAVPPRRSSRPASPRLSRQAGFWAVAFAFFAVTALSTTPSSLYGLYEHHEHLSSITITGVYAVYAAGIVISLVLAGHVSDWYGRRTVMLPALGVAIAATVVFLVWRSLPGLLVARVLTGLALGAAVATATAFITDLDGGPGGTATPRAGIVATIANISGLAAGPLVAGLLARYAADPLTLPFLVVLVALVLGVVLVLLAPEGHPAAHPRPRYHPQRLAAPAGARRQFAAAATGAFTAFAVAGLFAGLTGTLLAGPLRHHSPALTGVTIFLTFGTSVLVQTTTTSWPAHRLVAAGIPPLIAGLGLLVTSAWTSPPNLALFLTSGVVAGAGIGAIIRGSLTIAIAASGPDDRAGTLATFFTAGYVGLSLPVIGIGLSLQHLSPRVTLLIFGAAAAIVILAAAPTLARPVPDRPVPSEPATDPITSMCSCFGAQTQDPNPQPATPGGDIRSAKSQGDRVTLERDPRPHITRPMLARSPQRDERG